MPFEIEWLVKVLADDENMAANHVRANLQGRIQRCFVRDLFIKKAQKNQKRARNADACSGRVRSGN